MSAVCFSIRAAPITITAAISRHRLVGLGTSAPDSTFVGGVVLEHAKHGRADAVFGEQFPRHICQAVQPRVADVRSATLG